MSIVAESPTVAPGLLLVTAMLSLPALWFAARRSLVHAGREARLPDASLLLVPALLAFAAWVLVPSLILSAMQGASTTTRRTSGEATTRPTTDEATTRPTTVEATTWRTSDGATTWLTTAEATTRLMTNGATTRATSDEATTRAMTSGATTDSMTDAASSLPTSRPLDGSALAVLAVLAPLLPMMLLLAFDAAARPRLFDGIGLTRSHVRRGVLLGLLATVLVLPVVFLSSQLTQWFWNVLGLEHDNVHSLLRVMESGDVHVRALAVLAAVIVAPLFEELLFRGHLQSGLVSAMRNSFGPRVARWLAIVLASLAFASIHEWWTQPIIFVLSVCIGWVYERTGNLWAAIVLHASFNGTTTLLFTLSVMIQS